MTVALRVLAFLAFCVLSLAWAERAVACPHAADRTAAIGAEHGTPAADHPAVPGDPAPASACPDCCRGCGQALPAAAPAPERAVVYVRVREVVETAASQDVTTDILRPPQGRDPV